MVFGTDTYPHALYISLDTRAHLSHLIIQLVLLDCRSTGNNIKMITEWSPPVNTVHEGYGCKIWHGYACWNRTSMSWESLNAPAIMHKTFVILLSEQDAWVSLHNSEHFCAWRLTLLNGTTIQIPEQIFHKWKQQRMQALVVMLLFRSELTGMTK